MADPFGNVLFDPDQQGTLTGFIGRAMGNSSPTGDARRKAMSALSDLNDQYHNPQVAIAKFLQSPEGAEAFHRDPNLAESTVKPWLMAITPPPVQLQNVNAGDSLTSTDRNTGQTRVVASQPSTEQQNAGLSKPVSVSPGDQVGGFVPRTGAYTPQGSQPTQANQNAGLPTPVPVSPGGAVQSFTPGSNSFGPKVSQPTDKQQDFTGFQAIAQLPPDQLAQLAAFQMTPGDARQAQAVRELIGKTDDPRVKDQLLKVMAGAIQVKETRDSYGLPNGQFIMMDMSNPNQIVQVGPGAKPAPGNEGRVPAGANNGTGTAPPQPSQLNTDGSVKPQTFLGKDGMFFGAGMLPQAASYIGGALRQIDPGADVGGRMAEASGQRDYLDMVKFSLANLKLNAGSLGVSAAKVARAEGLGPSMWPGEDPLHAVQQAKRLHDYVSSEISAQQQDIADPYLPREVKQQAAGRIASWNEVLRSLPSMDHMNAVEKAIQNGSPQLMTPRGFAGSVAGSALQAGTSGANQAQGAVQDVRGAPTAETSPQQAQSRQELATVAKLTESNIQKFKPKTQAGQQALDAKLREMLAARRKAPQAAPQPAAHPPRPVRQPFGQPFMQEPER